MSAVRGDWTLDDITYAVYNNLESGLKTSTDYVFSTEQLRSEVLAERSMLLKAEKDQGIFDPFESYQEINCLELDCEDFRLCPALGNQKPALHFVLPAYIHIDYIGTPDQEKSFKLYTAGDGRYNKYRDKRLSKRPYVQLRPHKGEIHGFVFNPPTENLKYLSARLVLENPTKVNLYSCCSYNPKDDRFPAPDHMIQQIITGITSRWASWYYRVNPAKGVVLQNK